MPVRYPQQNTQCKVISLLLILDYMFFYFFFIVLFLWLNFYLWPFLMLFFFTSTCPDLKLDLV